MVGDCIIIIITLGGLVLGGTFQTSFPGPVSPFLTFSREQIKKIGCNHG